MLQGIASGCGNVRQDLSVEKTRWIFGRKSFFVAGRLREQFLFLCRIGGLGEGEGALVAGGSALPNAWQWSKASRGRGATVWAELSTLVLGYVVVVVNVVARNFRAPRAGETRSRSMPAGGGQVPRNPGGKTVIPYNSGGICWRLSRAF
ncbi:hypothetical protein Ancab_018623 [Ancistrocladus abbreviatus]